MSNASDRNDKASEALSHMVNVAALAYTYYAAFEMLVGALSAYAWLCGRYPASTYFLHRTIICFGAFFYGASRCDPVGLLVAVCAVGWFLYACLTIVRVVAFRLNPPPPVRRPAGPVPVTKGDHLSLKMSDAAAARLIKKVNEDHARGLWRNIE